MKYILHLSLSVIVFFSCSKNTDPIKPELTVGKEELSFGRDDDTRKLGIKSNTKRNITSSESWCTVSPSSGEAVTADVTVTEGIPVISGEYGAAYRADPPEPALSEHIKPRNDFLYYITKSAKDRGLISFYRDNGPTGHNASVPFNRVTGEHVHLDAVEAIIRGGR